MANHCSDTQLRFWSTLASRLCNGHPLGTALREAHDAVGDTPLAKAITKLADDVEAGSSLSQAMRNQPAVFGPAAACFVEGGERSGMPALGAMFVLEAICRCPQCYGLCPAEAG